MKPFSLHHMSAIAIATAAILVAIGCAAPNQSAATPTSAPKAASPTTQKPAQESATQAPANPAAKSSLETVKVGVLGIVSEAGLYVAEDKGYFAEQGIKAEFQNMVTSDQIAPLASGEVSVGQQAMGAGIINAIARGIPIKVAVGVHTIYPNKPTATRVVIRKSLLDSGQVKGPADLKGKTFAIESRGIGTETYFVRLLQQGGLKYPDDVKVVTMQMPDMITAFANSAIDLAFLSEPLVARGIAEGLIVDYKQPYELYPTHQLSVLIYSPNFVNNQTDLAKRFTLAYLKGTRDYIDAFEKGKDKETVIQNLINHTSIKDRALYDKMMPVTLAPNGEIRADDLEFQQNWFLESGVIKEKVAADRLIDMQFVKYAVDKLGEYK